MIVALQYYQNPDDGRGDLAQTMSLARLLADLEPEPRSDVLLALVSQPDTPRPPIVELTASHCRRRFPVVEVVSEYGARGHPEGCTALWRGTISYFYEKYIVQMINGLAGYHVPETESHASALLTLDGGDGVPLHRDWIDLLIIEHEMTLTKDKLITGTPYFVGTCPLHVNPNAVFNLQLFNQMPNLLEDVPAYDGTVMTNFDVHHREAMLSQARLTSAVRTDWRGDGRAISAEILRDRSRESVWLHGYRDENLYWLTREHLALDIPPPDIAEYSIEQLRLQETVRRDFERVGQEEAQKIASVKGGTPR